MNKLLLSTYLFIFLGVSQLNVAQVNITVKVKSVSVSTALDCDAGIADNSDFVFEFKALDNSPAGFSNNLPVIGSIGMCNYVVVNEDNGPFSLSPASPGLAIFSPTNGIFFDRSYNCKNEVPTNLSITWRAYENDDAIVPSITPIANGQIAQQVVTYTVPTSNGTYTTQFTQTSLDGTCPQIYTIEFEIKKMIGAFSPLSIGTLETHVICTGATNGGLESSAIGGSGTVLFDWSHDGLGDYDDNMNETGLPAGTYTLIIKDALNCTDTGVVTIFSTNAPVNISSFIASIPSVCTGQGGYIYSIASQTNSSIYWSYSGAGTVFNGFGSSVTLDFLSFATSGTLSVYAQNSCSTSPTFTMDIVVLPSPNVILTGNNTMCANGQELLSASGANSYSWSTSQTTSSIVVSPSVSTVYTVIATGLNGCNSIATHTMGVLSTPTLQISGSTVAVCPNHTVAASASGNGSLFIWSDGYIGANHTISASATTIYTVTNTFTNSCYTQQTFTLNVNSGPVLSVVGPTVICEKLAITLTANGANSYAWSNGVTTSVNSFTPIASTTLTLVGTALNGCQDSIIHTIDLVLTPTVSITGLDTICEGQFANLTANTSGLVTYGWNNGANTSSISVSPTGTFTYNVVVSNGGCTETASHEIYVKLIPFVDFVVDPTPLCTNGSIYTFTSNPSGGVFSGLGVTSNTFDPSIGVGSYPISYSLLFNNGCTSISTQTLQVMVCAGFENLTNDFDLLVFPNPTNSLITLKSNQDIKSILISDYSGKLIKIVEPNSNEIKMDLSCFANGFYFFTIQMLDQSQKTIKIIKD